MQRNYIPTAFLFTLTIAGILVLLTLFGSGFEIAGTEIKPVDIFSDVVKPKVSTPTNTNLQSQADAEPCPADVVCFTNYTGTDYPLDRVMQKIIGNAVQKNKIRIAWYGDSFSDGDILVSDLRDTLQSLYGGNGVGFVPITSEIAGFRQSLIHSFSGWNTYSILNNPGSARIGINGFGYVADSSNYVFYKGSKHFRHTVAFNTFNLFYSTPVAKQARIVVNQQKVMQVNLPASIVPARISVAPGTISQVKASLGRGVTVYGASLEDETGIYIDNFAIKGNSGLGLQGIPEGNLAAFDSLLHYDLIVLQFGLNVAVAKAKEFSNYEKGMAKLINRLKKAFPDTPILLLSVSDRSQRRQGQFATMPVIPVFIESQKKIASDNKLLFWNMFEAMGGENSMAGFANATPPLANKDYTHLNFAGGRKVGLAFARSFVHEVEKYQKRRTRIATITH